MVARIPLGSKPCAAAASRGLLWVSHFGDGTVRAIDPRQNRAVGRPLRVGAKPCGMSAGGGAVWVNGFGTNTVVKINPVQRRVVAKIPVGAAPYDVLFAAGAAWSSDNRSGWVSCIDPRTNRVVRKIRTDGAIGSDGLDWIPVLTRSRIVRIGASGTVVDDFATAAGPFVLTLAFGDIWVPSFGGQRVWRLHAR